MPVYNIAFYSILFFLIGVFLASLNLNFFIIIGVAVFFSILFLFLYFLNNKAKFSFLWLAGLSIIIILGGFYYFAQNSYQIKILSEL